MIYPKKLKVVIAGISKRNFKNINYHKKIDEKAKILKRKTERCSIIEQ